MAPESKKKGMPPGHAATLRAGLTLLPIITLGLPFVLAFGVYHWLRAALWHVYLAWLRPLCRSGSRGGVSAGAAGMHAARVHAAAVGAGQGYGHPALAEPAVTIARKLKEGVYTSEELVRAFIAQISRVNKVMNAVCDSRFDAAFHEAKEADRRLQAAKGSASKLAALPAFLGVPCSIKECIAVAGMSQSSGVVARKGVRATEDASVVARYRAAGFIVLVNTNLSELCMWYSSANRLNGTTNNAYDQTRIVGGSSGGEAALISAAGAPCGIGSDIGGSIRMPAGFNGIFGHKPTGGLVPNTGQHPVTKYPFLVTGPLCRYSDDLWPLLATLIGPDGKDPACVPMTLVDVSLGILPSTLKPTLAPQLHVATGGRQPSSLMVVDRVEPATAQRAPRGNEGFTRASSPGKRRATSKSPSRGRARDARHDARTIDASSPVPGTGMSSPSATDGISNWHGVTIFKVAGFPDKVRPRLTTMVQPAILQAIDVAANTMMRSYGCRGVEFVDMPELVDAFDLWASVLNEAEQPTFFELMVEAHGRPLNLGWEVVKWSVGASEATLPALVLAAVEKIPQYAVPSRHAACLAAAEQLKHRLHETLARCNGVLLFPVHPTTAPLHDVPLIRPFNCSYTQIFNVLEVPSTVVPMGLDRDGLPVAIQVIAARGFDKLTIAVAQALEHAGVGGWVPPLLALGSSADGGSSDSDATPAGQKEL